MKLKNFILLIAVSIIHLGKKPKRGGSPPSERDLNNIEVLRNLKFRILTCVKDLIL